MPRASSKSNRRRLRTLQGWAIAAGATLALFVAVTTADAPVLPGSPEPPSKTLRGYGFSTSLSELNATQLEERLAGIAATGATWVRLDLDWDAIQPHSSATYKWAETDRLVKAARNHKLEVILIIDFTPRWARPATCPGSKLCGPAHPQEYAAFAAEAAKHYQPLGVSHWEIWNEPNISYRFRPAADVATYASMLKLSYITIKHIDPSATIIAASLAPSATKRGNYSPADFVRQLYEQGAGGNFDAISAHPYTYPSTPASSTPADAWGQLTTIHDLMVAGGDGDKKVWITEFGAPTGGPDIPGEKVSETEQAQIAAEAMSQFRRHDWAGPFLWYDYQDVGQSTSTSENFYGLIRYDGSPKPAYDVFVEAVRR